MVTPSQVQVPSALWDTVPNDASSSTDSLSAAENVPLLVAVSPSSTVTESLSAATPSTA